MENFVYKKYLFIIILVIIQFIPGHFYGESFTELNGYVKTFFTTLQFYEHPWIENRTGNENYHRVRLELITSPLKNLEFNAGYEIITQFSDINETFKSDLVTDTGDFTGSYMNIFYRKDSDRLLDINDIESGKLKLINNIDRLNVKLSVSHLNLILGRQAVTWGSGRALNPTDIFSPFTTSDLNKEYKRGVDALRAEIETSNFSGIDLVAALGKKPEEGKYASRFFFKLLETDMALSFAYNRNNLRFGADMERGIGGLNAHIESVYILPDKGDPFIELITGLDYMFSFNLYMSLEFFYNGFGVKKSEDYLKLYMSEENMSLMQKEYLFFSGRQYGIFMLNYEIHPLVHLISSAVVNGRDPSFLEMIYLAFDIYENVALHLGGLIPVGRRPDSELPYTINSEFGLSPYMFFLGTNVYF